MGSTESEKTKEYDIVPTGKPVYPTVICSAPSSDKKKKKFKKSFLLCCSNVEFNDEAEKDKVMEISKSNKFRKSCLLMFCSNIEVGKKSG